MDNVYTILDGKDKKLTVNKIKFWEPSINFLGNLFLVLVKVPLQIVAMTLLIVFFMAWAVVSLITLTIGIVAAAALAVLFLVFVCPLLVVLNVSLEDK